MIVLTGSSDDSIVIALADDSEIEITITEIEGSKAKVVICAGEAVSIMRKHAIKPLWVSNELTPDSDEFM